MNGAGETGDQEVTRPSELVWAVKVSCDGEEEVGGGLCRTRLTGMEGAGRPRVVSRTWHVIGGLGAVVVVVVVDIVVGGCADERCVVRSESRDVGLEVVVGLVGMRGV